MKQQEILDIFEDVNLESNRHHFENISQHWFDEVLQVEQKDILIESCFFIEFRLQGRFFTPTFNGTGFIINDLTIIEVKLYDEDMELVLITEGTITRIEKLLKRKISEL